MKLGIFDSGIGGILITKAIHERFPEVDKVYLGDTMNLPYGARSEETIYRASRNCVDALFQRDCQLVIVACNTASARALRRLQQEYLPQAYPDRRILGVVVPTLEEAIERGYKKLAVIGTNYTIETGIYSDELKKINPDIEIVQKRTPLLVPLIENNGDAYLDAVLDDYLAFAQDEDFDALLLGCTHYMHLKDRIDDSYDFDVLAQDDIIPNKLNSYFKNHSEVIDKISKNGNLNFYITDLTPSYAENASALFGQEIKVRQMEDVHG